MAKLSFFKDKGALCEPEKIPGLAKVKGAAVLSLPVVTGMMLPMTALAADAGSSPTGDLFDTIAASMVASIQDMVSAVGSAIGSIIPVAFPIICVGMGITICLVVFRRITNQA